MDQSLNFTRSQVLKCTIAQARAFNLWQTRQPLYALAATTLEQQWVLWLKYGNDVTVCVV